MTLKKKYITIYILIMSLVLINENNKYLYILYLLYPVIFTLYLYIPYIYLFPFV